MKMQCLSLEKLKAKAKPPTIATQMKIVCPSLRVSRNITFVQTAHI